MNTYIHLRTEFRMIIFSNITSCDYMCSCHDSSSEFATCYLRYFAMYLRCVAVSKGYVFTLLCSKSSAVLPLGQCFAF